jgi:hypothetical protein
LFLLFSVDQQPELIEAGGDATFFKSSLEARHDIGEAMKALLDSACTEGFKWHSYALQSGASGDECILFQIVIVPLD